MSKNRSDEKQLHGNAADNIQGYSSMLTSPILYLTKAAIFNITTLCLNGTLPCVDFMDVIMGDIPRPEA